MVCHEGTDEWRWHAVEQMGEGPSEPAQRCASLLSSTSSSGHKAHQPYGPKLGAPSPQRSDKYLTELAAMYNPCIRGWITYYRHFYKTQLRHRP
jgi:Group II intron, maturase-specific domain